MKFIEFITGEVVDLNKVLYFVSVDDVSNNGDVFFQIKFYFKELKSCTVEFKDADSREKAFNKIKEIVEAVSISV